MYILVKLVIMTTALITSFFQVQSKKHVRSSYSGTMNEEQQHAYQRVIEGHSILLTGAAGCGKSFTLSNIIKWAHDNDIKLGVTSTTGSSALLISGRTLHSFLGIGLGSKQASVLASALKKKPKIAKKLKKLDLLIIDEISMANSELFEKISEFLSLVRKNPLPFGGIQLILCGDFCQLPPIEGVFCFKSLLWKKMNIEKVVLTKQVRQQNSPEFQEILENLRWGNCTPEILKILKSTKNNKFPEGIIPTKIYSKNIDVDAINKKHYEELVSTGAETRTYNSKYSAENAKSWGSSSKIPEEIEMCVGAQVFCSANLPETRIVNGSRGVVTQLCDNGVKVKFVTGEEIIIEHFTRTCEDDESISISHIPLKLAYAVTVHKSQGCTLDAAEVDLGPSIFEYGMAYTVISRVRDLNSIRIVNVLASSFRTHPDVLKFYGK